MNTNAAELAPDQMGDSYTTSVQLMVTDTVNNKTASKDIEVVIYPAFNPVKFTFDYHEKYRIVDFHTPSMTILAISTYTNVHLRAA